MMDRPFGSRVIEPYDYKKVDFMKSITPFVFDEEQFGQDLDFLKKKYAYIEAVTSIEMGDVATLRCHSEAKKFQKEKITLQVGKNLYSKELEEQLIGWQVNDCRKIKVGENQVKVEVLAVERRMLPELTDEFIDCTFTELTNYKDLVKWYENQQKENYLLQESERIAESVIKEVIGKSTFEIQKEERQQAREEGHSIVEEMWNFNGVPLDTMSDEQAEELLGYPSVQAYIDWYMDLCEESFYMSLLGYEWMQTYDKVPDRNQYELQLISYAEEEGKTVEEMEKIFTFTAFNKQICAEKYNELIKEFIYTRLKEMAK